MSRYQWPRTRRNPDRALERAAWNAATDGLVTEADVAKARAARATAHESRSAFAGTLAAPQGLTDLWVPIGPSVVVKGQAHKLPRVAGRIRDLAVSPTGRRAYAASANGGVWYTEDYGTSWAPIGNWLPTPSDSRSTRVAQSALTCGCLLVSFGVFEDVTRPLDDPGRFIEDSNRDVVYVGTGELLPMRSGTPGAKHGGIGVLHLTTTVATAVADPFGNHWAREAPELAGHGIFRMARDPNDPDTLIAVTTAGVFTRTGPFVAEAAWNRIDRGPLDFDATDLTYGCDVVWMKDVPNGLVVALYGAKQGVFCSDNGIAGPFDRIGMPGLKPGRLTLAANEPSKSVHVLGDGPTLHRIDFPSTGQPQSRRYKNLPDRLFDPLMEGKSSAWYNMAVAVEPNDSSRVFIAGQATSFDGDWNAALYRASVDDDNGTLDFTFSKNHQDTPGISNTWVGSGIHADVHRICLVQVGTEIHGWIACDGGVFRSTTAGIRGTYVSCNVGLAVLEGGYVASHPTNDHFVILGTQDNGVLQRVGDSVWLHTSKITGDGGGVAFHPTTPRYFLGQYSRADWRSAVDTPKKTGVLSPPVFRSAKEPESEKRESGRSSFYSGVDVMPVSPGATAARIAIGTNRVWVSENWTPSTVGTNTWVTLPSGIDPRERNPRDHGTDVSGSYKQVIALRWHPDGRLFVLYQNALIVYRRPAANGGTRWSTTSLTKTESVCGDFENGDIDQPSSEYLPPLGEWSDLFIDDIEPDKTSCYVACTGHGRLDDNTVIESDRMDTLWWYDGNGKWWPTGLRNDDVSGSTGVRAPAFAVIVDPDDRNIVYVGTALGVWRGERDLSGTTPVWLWAPFDNGLPEALVQDLSLFGPHDNVKLLRAALQSRGVWEIDLSPAPSPVQRVYLRAHPNDARRRLPATFDIPTATERDIWPWYICPDIRIVDGTAPEPWNAGTPTEADFVEYKESDGALVALDAAVPSRLGDTQAKLIEPLGSYTAVARVYDEVYTVHVLVHSRNVTSVPDTDISVAVFLTRVPPSVEEWAAFKITPGQQQAIVDLLTSPTPAPWPFAFIFPVNRSVPRRQPAAPIDARTPRTVSFEMDLAGLESGHYAVLAVVSSAVDPVTEVSLGGSTLEAMVRNSHHVGLRFVEKI